MDATEAGDTTRRAGQVIAGLASAGAGAIHATAVGVHGEHRQAAVMFGLLALLQLGWGGLALAPGRMPAWLVRLGLVGNGAAVAGWVVAKTTGVGWIDGLERSEGPELADTLAAGLGAVAVVAAVGAALDLRVRRGAAGRFMGVPAAAVLTSAVVLVGMVSAGGHDHGGGHGGDHVHAGAQGDDHDHEPAGDDHDHGRGSGDHDHGGAGGHRAVSPAGHAHPAATPDGDHTHGEDPAGDPAGHEDDHDDPGGHDHPGEHDEPGGHDPGGHEPGGHDPGSHGPPPYDATLPVDLSGVPGVTPAQEASAEALVTDTLVKLPPRLADPSAAVAAGYRTVADAFTGYEHFVNWALIDDGRILDADHPEAIVYRVDGSRRTLVSAMYMLGPDDTLDTVPDVGGPLVQWHVHDDLCFAGEENAWRVAGVVPPPGECRAGTFRLPIPPMVHVWVVPHECGPFAALEGVGGGQVRPGEEPLCDHAHGSH